MKKRIILASMATGLMTISLSSMALSADLKLAHQFSPDSLPGEAATHFANLVKEKSGGEVNVTVLPGGALGDERANLQQLGNGSIDMALTGDLVTSYMAQPYMIVSMPFTYDSPDHSLAVFNGEIGDEIGDYLIENHGIRSLAWQYVGTRVLTASKPVRNLDDLKGLKTRLPGVEMWVKAWEKTGVDVASIAFTELYLALQTGTVDAQENPPNFIRAQKFNEVQDYVMETNHVPQMQVFFINDDLFQGLDEPLRQAISAAADETADWASARANDLQISDLEWLTTEGGMELIEIDLTGIDDLVKNVPEEVLGAEGVALYERIQAAKP